MNFAWIVDGCVQNSYYVKDRHAFKMKDDTPYIWHHSIDNRCSMGPFAYPFCFDGYLINWTEWNELPDIDLDLIFLSIEKNMDKYSIVDVRKKYPNAIILGTIKELYFIHSYHSRIELFKKCDGVVIPYKDSIYKMFPNLEKDVGKTIYYLPQPYDIDFLYKNFYNEEREDTIFSYIPPHPPRRGKTEEFANYIGNKYNVPVIRKETKFSPTQWLDFLTLFSTSTFCFNLDPEPQQGQQGIQCAILGIINIGGVNDSHFRLFPDTATNNFETLENKFLQYFEDEKIRNDQIKTSFNMAEEIYSFTAIKTRLDNILEELQ